MSDLMAQFRQELEELKKKYSIELPSKVQDIENGWKTYLEEPNAENITVLHRLVHTIKGSSATFGFDEVSKAAATLETLLKPWVKSESLPGEELVPEFQGLLKTLYIRARNVSLEDASVVAEPQPKPDEHELERRRKTQKPLIYLYEPNGKIAGDIVRQMASFSYRVESFTSLSDLVHACSIAPPSGFVVDFTGMSSERLPEITKDLLNPVCDVHGRKPLLVAVSNDDSFACRLAAVRAGAVDFFTLPLDIGNLVDSFERMIFYRDDDPFRILIIDDDEDLARHFELVLQGRGWLTKTLSNPMDVFLLLSEFRPDLILMDLYMPDVNGVELAAVIRQKEEYVSIPIVYLSIEDDLETQLEAVGPGADDFLNKGIHPEHLIVSVESRVLRYRELRRLMTRDSLTGLLNHTNLKMRLVMEMNRAVRQETKLAFAMIDLDHFKKVNDTYGHPTGDLVLKSVAKLLNQRLRRSDVIGRYGGEEFGVILLDVESADVVQSLLDELRVSFAEISHNVGDAHFNVTLSCGAAMFPEYSDPQSISDAADKALYKAKSHGRNRVVVV
ncbi:MAG: diguanylate cyclase [Desulfovibrio sp.]|uniref:diguanylate cyclase n=1 Tax=Desulfovibrio sp. 7SRBS1 TaxID=3378064 RepID=UPI003B3F637A